MRVRANTEQKWFIITNGRLLKHEKYPTKNKHRENDDKWEFFVIHDPRTQHSPSRPQHDAADCDIKNRMFSLKLEEDIETIVILDFLYSCLDRVVNVTFHCVYTLRLDAVVGVHVAITINPLCKLSVFTFGSHLFAAKSAAFRLCAKRCIATVIVLNTNLKSVSWRDGTQLAEAAAASCEYRIHYHYGDKTLK